MNQDETIFVQTDPAFNIVLHSLAELRGQNRLRVTHHQAATLRNIESNDDNEDRNLMFGGEKGKLTNSAFGRTASAVVRMTMLEAAGVRRSLWPSVGSNTSRRNKANLQNPLAPQPRLFSLANDTSAARRYWSKYDQLYPHFRIEHEVSQVNLNSQVSIGSMMLIFRSNFTEVIEITTTFTATPRENQQFDSYIYVICIVREISESTEEGEDGKFTRELKKLMVPVEIEEQYFEEMTKVKEMKDIDLAFAKLNLEVDNNE